MIFCFIIDKQCFSTIYTSLSTVFALGYKSIMFSFHKMASEAYMDFNNLLKYQYLHFPKLHELSLPSQV